MTNLTSIAGRVATLLTPAAQIVRKSGLSATDLSLNYMLRTRSGERVVPPTERIRFSPDTRRRISARQENHCMYCGVRLSKNNLHLDHIYPRDHGGSNDESNLQALCAACNTRKGVQTDAELRKRYHPLMPIQPTGFPPATRIPQSQFRAITQRTTQAQSTVARRKAIYLTPMKKIMAGSAVAGVITGGVWFVAMPLIFGGHPVVGNVAFFGGLLVLATTWAGFMYRAKTTGLLDQ